MSSKGSLLLLLGLASVRYCLAQSSHQEHLKIPSNPPLRLNISVNWTLCGTGSVFECAEPSYVCQHMIVRTAHFRKGAIFLNPGGPGVEGAKFTRGWGPSMARLFRGQYDLIGFDPRGVRASDPYVSCFESALDEQAYELSARSNAIEIPVNLSIPGVYDDVSRQVDIHSASITSLARQCVNRSASLLPFLGTEFVAKDVDHLARLIEGDDKPLNYWGFSYGSVLGQYMVQVLPPERLGRIVIDGDLSGETWAHNNEKAFKVHLQDADAVAKAFASACIAAGESCALAKGNRFTSPSTLLAAIDRLLDELYKRPIPALHLNIPTGNFTEIAKFSVIAADGEQARRSDSSAYANPAIMCADAQPYSLHRPPPTTAKIVKDIFDNLRSTAPRFGIQDWDVVQCMWWAQAGLPDSRSRLSGPFTMTNGSLNTPMLVISNTLDPVSPLAEAKLVKERLGNNARLIQQTGGLGHCALSHFSYCTARVIRDYMVDGKVPEDDHTYCQVDQVPFEPFERPIDLSRNSETGELWDAWRELSRDFAFA